MQLLRDSIELTKPRITLLALLTTAAGYALAPTSIMFSQAFWTLMGVGFLVAGAGTLNMYLEREVDRFMKRTSTRPLPQGRLTPEWSLGLGAILIGLSFPMLYFGASPLAAALGFFSLMAYVLVYTPLKRRSSLSLWVGAVPGAMPPLIGWASATGGVSLPGWVLFGIVFFWQIPHFLAIGLFRREEYLEAGFEIFPKNLSFLRLRMTMLATGLCLLPLSLWLYFLLHLSHFYLGAALVLNLVFLGSMMLKVSEEKVWGRRVFILSLIYLTGLFVFLFV